MNIKRAIGGPLLSFVFLILFTYIVFGIQWISENYFKDKNIFLGSISDAFQNDGQQNTTQTVEKPGINAVSAISLEINLKESEDRIILDKDSSIKLPIASLTKLMTAIIVLDNYNLSSKTVVSKTADSQDPMKQDVKLGDKMSVEAFLDIMLVGSSNKSAYALSELVGEKNFVDFMNQKAKDLGLNDTFFEDPTGLSPNNVSTARDLAKLAEHILKNYPKIAIISKVREFYVPEFGIIKNTDQLLEEIPDIICSKTGFTTAAKGCLLLVIDNPKNDNYLINVILGADDRFAEMKKIINYSSSTCN